MKQTYDVVIVGGGHNGLTAASYLARTGRSVAVLERLDHVGGAAISAQAFEGVDARLSRYSYLVSLLPQRIIDDLGAAALSLFLVMALMTLKLWDLVGVATPLAIMLVVQVADMPAYHALAQRLFTQDANVRNVKAYFGVKRAKFETARSIMRNSGPYGVGDSTHIGSAPSSNQPGMTLMPVVVGSNPAPKTLPWT